MNDQIRVPRVRVISETGEQLGVIPTREAQDRARSLGLDLMEVAPNENPPVCKIMDFGKYKYQMQKKEHQARKKQHIHEQKELRIRPKTDDHDIGIKLNKAREFLEDGSKVQFTMIFRGREQLHQSLGRETFQEIVAKLDDVGKIERETRMEGRRMIMILAPKIAKKPVGKPNPVVPSPKQPPKDAKPQAPSATAEQGQKPEQPSEEVKQAQPANPPPPAGTANDSTPVQV